MRIVKYEAAGAYSWGNFRLVGRPDIYPKKFRKKILREVVESEVSVSPPLWKTMRISIGNEKFSIFPLYFLEEFLIVTAKKLHH